MLNGLSIVAFPPSFSPDTAPVPPGVDYLPALSIPRPPPLAAPPSIFSPFAKCWMVNLTQGFRYDAHSSRRVPPSYRSNPNTNTTPRLERIVASRLLFFLFTPVPVLYARAHVRHSCLLPCRNICPLCFFFFFSLLFTSQLLPNAWPPGSLSLIILRDPIYPYPTICAHFPFASLPFFLCCERFAYGIHFSHISTSSFSGRVRLRMDPHRCVYSARYAPPSSANSLREPGLFSSACFVSIYFLIWVSVFELSFCRYLFFSSRKISITLSPCALHNFNLYFFFARAVTFLWQRRVLPGR